MIFNNLCFQGSWELESSDILSIEKTGEVYKCIWKISENKITNEYIGIGMLIDDKLHISKLPINAAGGGICLYKHIGDLRSISALWASSNNFNTLGAGIALRKQSSNGFHGSYKVKYFVSGNEYANFDLTIKENRKIYSLLWTIEDNIISQGIGFIDEGKLAAAWSEPDMKCELIILSFKNENELIGKHAISGSDNIVEKYYIKTLPDVENVL